MNKNIFDIHGDDEMLLHLRDSGTPERVLFSAYLGAGYLIWQQLKQILAIFNRDVSSLHSVLDFASGYGRVTRFLVEDILPQKVTVSDIYANAVKYQTEKFGVRGVVSNENPDDVKLEGPFSAIFCVSLFSHLPKDLFISWLDRLLNLCETDGLFIFTTHSTDLISGWHKKNKDFYYDRESESRSLDKEIYGTTYVKYSFIEDLINSRYSNKKIVGYCPKFIANHQDVYVIGDSSETLREISKSYAVRGYIDKVEKKGRNLDIAGWAYSEQTKAPVKIIRAYTGHGECPCNLELGQRREDVARFFNEDTALYSGFTSTIGDISNDDKAIMLELVDDSNNKGALFLNGLGKI